MGRKLFSIRKPHLRVTKKGLKFQAPSMRIGGKAGVNISKSGTNASFRSRYASYNTKRGLSLGCLPVLALGLIGVSALYFTLPY